MDIQFFGDYLLHKGLIDIEQLNSAVDFQLEHNLSLGELAFQEKFLNRAEIDKIRDLQKKEDTMFGEAAIKLQLLSKSQVEHLLSKQKKINIIFGKALEKKGFLSNIVIENEIEEFEKDQRDRINHINTELAFCDHTHLLQDSVHIFQNLFFRFFQEHIKLQEVECFATNLDNSISFKQSLSGDIEADYIISFEKDHTPSFSKFSIDSNNCIAIFKEFMEDFVKMLALYLNSKGIVVNVEECSLIDQDPSDLSEYGQLKFITTNCNILLCAKV